MSIGNLSAGYCARQSTGMQRIRLYSVYKELLVKWVIQEEEQINAYGGIDANMEVRPTNIVRMPDDNSKLHLGSQRKCPV